jgi:hypothetical protein
MERTSGISPADWAAAKSEVRAILADVARQRGLISYSALVEAIEAVRLDRHDAAVARLLREVSTDDRAHGRGMRSALVVLSARGRPGAGFFALARSLGEDVSDPDAFWRRELVRVYADWGTG